LIKTFNSSLLEKTLILFSGNTLNSLFSCIFSIWLTRELGPEKKGVITIALSSCDLLSALFSIGIPYSAAYFVRSHPGSQSQVKSIANRAMLLSCFLSFVFIALGKDLFASFFLSGWSIDLMMVLLLIFTVTINSGNAIIGAAIKAEGNSKSFVMSTLIGTLITIFLTSGLFFFTNLQKLHAVLLGALVGNIVATIIMRKSYYSLDSYLAAPQRFTIREFYKFSIQAHAGAVAMLIFKRMDIYFISHFLNIASVGFYSVGIGLREIGMSISRAVSDIVGGEMADPQKKFNGSAKKAFRKGVVFIMASSFSILLFAILLFPCFIPLVYGKEFLMAINPATITMASLIPASITLLLGKALHAQGRPLHLSIGNILNAVICAVISWQLTKVFGLKGAAVSTLINGTIFLLTGYILLQFDHKRNYKENIVIKK